MKKLSALPLLIALFVCANLYSQAPKLLNYQAVVRNAQGNPVTNHKVNFEFVIHAGSVNGGAVFTESGDTATTNQFGLASVQIGLITNLGSVNWGNGNKYLQVEVDITGGTNFVDMGTTQLISVPYALYADTAAVANAANSVTTSTANVQVFTSSGTWTKPSGVSMVEVICVGGGGGGGGGAGSASSSAFSSGGGGGAYTFKMIGASILSSTVSVTVGLGGNGGIGGTGYGLGGGGDTGGVSSFGTYVVANGGGGGGCGSANGGTGGISEYSGGNGGNGGNVGFNGANSINGGGGGGAGGGGGHLNGYNGGTCGYSGNGALGGTAGNQAGNGQPFTTLLSGYGGQGGGGGYGAAGTVTGNGGAGGGGGGGGGFGGNAGGNGGNGVVVVYSW